MAVIDEAPRSCDVISMCPVKIIRIPAEHFLEALDLDTSTKSAAITIIHSPTKDF